jgi:hypothetical protein
VAGEEFTVFASALTKKVADVKLLLLTYPAASHHHLTRT